MSLMCSLKMCGNVNYEKIFEHYINTSGSLCSVHLNAPHHTTVKPFKNMYFWNQSCRINARDFFANGWKYSHRKAAEPCFFFLQNSSPMRWIRNLLKKLMYGIYTKFVQFHPSFMSIHMDWTEVVFPQVPTNCSRPKNWRSWTKIHNLSNWITTREKTPEDNSRQLKRLRVSQWGSIGKC